MEIIGQVDKISCSVNSSHNKNLNYIVGSGKIFHPGTASGGNGSKCSFGDDMV